MSNCTQSNCECSSCQDEAEATVQIEHNIKVTHVQQKVVHYKAPRKSSDKVVSKAGGCMNDPDGCSIEDVKSMAGSILSVSQGHDDPVFKASGVFVEEFIMDDYDDEDESWEDYTVVKCNCGNLAAKDCDDGSCGKCCSGCSRHG